MVPRVRKVLRETIVEDRRRDNFIRIYPSEGCQIYDRYFRCPRSSNKALYNILYRAEETLGTTKTRTAVLSPQVSNGAIDPASAGRPLLYHTGGRRIVGGVRKEKMAGRTQSPAKNKRSVASMAGSPARIAGHEASHPAVAQDSTAHLAVDSGNIKEIEGKSNSRPRERKVLITGDDVLIEYVIRLSDILASIREDWLDGRCLDAMCKFVENPIWKTTVSVEGGKQYGSGYTDQTSIQNRVHSRLIEMKMRYAEMQHQIAMAGEGNREDAKDEEQELRKEKTKILRAFASEQLEHILFKSARNSKCGAIESLFISMNPIQGVLTYLQRQFGRTKPAKATKASAASGATSSAGQSRKQPGNRRDVRLPTQQSPLKTRKSYAERPAPDLCALPSIGETKVEPASKRDPSGQATCRSLTSRGGAKCGNFADKMAAHSTSSERKGSFGETITKLKGMLKQEPPATSYGSTLPQKRNGSKVKEAAQKMFGTFRGSNPISIADIDNKYIAVNLKRAAL